MKIQPLMALVVLSLATVPGARAATVWNGPTISFIKSNYVNPLLAQNQDRLTANVWITRGSSQGLFNANTESSFTHYLSPAGTEWANGSLENYATLSYTNWNRWAAGVNPSPRATVGVQAVMHLIPDDIYLSVQFTSWSGGASGGGPSYGGGFSYLRSTPVPEPQVNYAISGSGAYAYVTSSPNASGDIVIASTYLGYPVTHIDQYAFSRCTSLTSVTIPNSVWAIGSYAFSPCTSLTNVTIPNSVTYLGQFAFLGCTSLTSVTIPDGLDRIELRAFYGCTSLTSVTIGNGVIYIVDDAFENCTSLTNVTIPNSVTYIGGAAFGGCTSLTSVTIGNSVTTIWYDAFLGCTSLTNFSVAAANPAYSSLDGVLFDKAQMTLFIFPLGRGGSYVIPNSVTSIRYLAFSGCTSLTSVTIGNSVTGIGPSAFSGCTSLTSVTIGNSVTNTGVSAFSGCTSLTNVTIPNSVTGIGNASFSGCTSLTSVTIPNSVTRIGYEAFMSCTNLANFTFLGNAPVLIPYPSNSFSGRWFANVGAAAKAYYYCGTTGWGTGYGGLPTVMLCPPQVAPGSAGVKPGGFGFTLTRLTNQTIVVEASTNLVNWQPIWTNAPPGASAEFVDPEWLNHSNRFYRARSD